MPIGRLEQSIRKPSSLETLCISTNSTLESRLSSNDIPKMELLKINYVNQCKQAVSVTRSTPSPRSPIASSSASSSPTSKPRIESDPTRDYRFLGYKRPNSHPEMLSKKDSSVTMIEKSHHETWDFLQNKRAIPTAAASSPIEVAGSSSDCRDCCSECSDCSSGTTDSLSCSGAVEKSNSWNYRSKFDIPKKPESVSIPRTERYTKIDSVDRRDHEKVQMRHPNSIIGAKSSSDVSKIQRMFESASQHQRNHHVPKRESLDSEPSRKLNSRQADSPRRRTFSPAGSDERIKRLEGQPYDSDCCECKSNRKLLSDQKSISRIPKKVDSNDQLSRQNKKMMDHKAESKDIPGKQFKKQDVHQILSRQISADVKALSKNYSEPTETRSWEISKEKSKSEPNELVTWQAQKQAETKSRRDSSDFEYHPRNESNEQFNRQIKKMFQTSEGISSTSINRNRFYDSSPSSDNDLPQIIDSKMLRKRNPHQIKVERIHIRKKRQPLLIINQLSDSSSPTTAAADHYCEKSSNNNVDKSKNTCGFKKCTFSNCPMSANDPHNTNDSPKDQLVKENNKKNLEKSTSSQTTTEKKIILASPMTQKKKLSTVDDDGDGDHHQRIEDQVTIVINRGQQSSGDPNDVQNFSNKNLTKATTDELLAPSVLNNTIVIKSPSSEKISNVDVNLMNIQNRKFNDLKNINHWTEEAENAGGHHHRSQQQAHSGGISSSDHVRNSVKIFVRNYPVNSCSSSTTSTSSSADSNSLSSADADDRGRRVGNGVGDLIKRYDSQQTASGSSCVTLSSSSAADDEEYDDDDGSGSALSADLRKYQSDCSSSSNCSLSVLVPASVSSATSSSRGTATIQSVFPPSSTKFGCDGGIFWNNCYFYDGDKSNYCCSAISCDDENCPYYDLEDDETAAHQSSDKVDGCCKEKGTKQKVTPVSAAVVVVGKNRSPRKADVIHDMRPRSMDGVVDSGVSLNGDTGSSPDSEHMQNQQDSRLKRGHVLSELLETERIYVTEMSSILKGYCDQMQSEELMHLVPASLQGKEDILFGNLHELYTFHSEIFLKDLENCISTTELVALCFVQRRDTFYRLYSFYCQNIPRSERLRETLVDTHLFLQECQKRLGHKLPLAAYLLKPVQRITKYQLLLKDLLRFSDSGSCTKELQKALDCMLIVLKCVNDSMHQIAITGFPSDLSQQGELLLQDSFQVWTESKKDIRLRIKPQQRHIFLYQKSMLFCKQTSKTGHNKSTYQFKHYVKMSQIGLTESVKGDPKRFEVWLQGRQEVHTLQAPTIDVKNKWVAEVKRVLLNQLEELKGEKIKQYGLNHRGLRQTASWDTPNSIISTPQRTMSCEVSSESNRNSNCSSEDSCPPHTPGVSSISSTEKENPDGCGWSSDYSNSEDEMSMIEDNSTPIPIQKVGPQPRTWNQSIENHLEVRVGIKNEQ
ncbi:uncharacterized protein LOC129952343 isoform X2 [Eupeodes corollae]|uniref:uncharacterized protein LOC129952343 isoform X2 n=1 Tax=Eupeodes corollae TaxID=290404 RepID=UPI002491BE59|nr:uncharacterized protein LOC129952343 isoform X2 [Eupeodes corollae]